MKPSLLQGRASGSAISRLFQTPTRLQTDASRELLAGRRRPRWGLGVFLKFDQTCWLLLHDHMGEIWTGCLAVLTDEEVWSFELSCCVLGRAVV